MTFDEWTAALLALESETQVNQFLRDNPLELADRLALILNLSDKALAALIVYSEFIAFFATPAQSEQLFSRLCQLDEALLCQVLQSRAVCQHLVDNNIKLERLLSQAQGVAAFFGSPHAVFDSDWDVIVAAAKERTENDKATQALLAQWALSYHAILLKNHRLTKLAIFKLFIQLDEAQQQQWLGHESVCQLFPLAFFRDHLDDARAYRALSRFPLLAKSMGLDFFYGVRDLDLFQHDVFVERVFKLIQTEKQTEGLAEDFIPRLVEHASFNAQASRALKLAAIRQLALNDGFHKINEQSCLLDECLLDAYLGASKEEQNALLAQPGVVLRLPQQIIIDAINNQQLNAKRLAGLLAGQEQAALLTYLSTAEIVSQIKVDSVGFSTIKQSSTLLRAWLKHELNHARWDTMGLSFSLSKLFAQRKTPRTIVSMRKALNEGQTLEEVISLAREAAENPRCLFNTRLATTQAFYDALAELPTQGTQKAQSLAT